MYQHSGGKIEFYGSEMPVLFQTNKGSSQIRAAILYLTDQIRGKVSLTLICSGLPLFD